MSSKAFLKIMKDRQKAQDKQSEQQAAAEESAKPVVSIPVAAPKPKFGGNPFAVFQQQDSEEEEEEKPTKTTNGETKPSEHADDDESDAEDAENADAAGAGAAKKKKRKRKNKKKKRDLHEVLAEQEEQEAAPVPADEVQDKQEVLEASNALELNPKAFNYNKELDKYFKGEKLVEDADVSGMSKRDKGYAKLMQTKYKKHKQYILCQSQDIVGNLPDRLNCDFIRVNDFGQKVFVFKPTPRFETIAEMYEHIRDSNDPNEMVDFVQQNPFYPEAVYDLGEYFRLKSNFKEANKLLERVMYLYEDSFSFDFQVFDNDLENVCCLDYEYNSFTGLFFKAVFKFIAILTKKGCYQSALEFNKLLLKMSPGKDPLGALFYIDHTALSAKKFDFFENFAFHFADQYLTVGKHSAKSSILLYPNVIYSLALCKFYRVLDECHKCEANPNDRLTKIEGSLAKDLENFSLQMDMSHNYWLALAFLMYPSLLKKILEETELNKQSAGHSSHKDWQKKSWAEIFNHQTTLRTEKDYVYSVLNVGNEQDTEGIEKVTAIYPTRNKILWRNKFVNIWTKTVVGHVLNLMDSKQFNVDAFMEALIMPLDDKSKDTPSGRLAKHILPFEPRIHRKLVVKDFSDAEDNLDLNNIPDNDPLAQHQGNPIQEANPLDVNQNWLQLLVNTLMPWNDLPPQQRGPNPNNQPDDNEDIRED